jgi:V/A-type H+-transporting ATPase subunit I
MALFLPLFFGMILGDIAYGLILFMLTLVLRKRIGSGFMGDLLKIIRMGSLWAIVFGVLYGEFLGTLGHSLGLKPIWLDRAEKESLVPLLLVVIGIGAAHMVLGLILGVWRAWLVKNRTHLLERGGMLVGLVGVFALVGVFTHLIPEVFTIPAASVVVIGIALLGYSIGKAGFIVGPIEFIGVIGNILSYIRIAAVGLSSVYLAKVANDLAGYFGSLVVGVIIATLFHGLNLVIGTFSPSIHSLRLMYVEFFRKFYEGGGKVYQPFGYRETMR